MGSVHFLQPFQYENVYTQVQLASPGINWPAPTPLHLPTDQDQTSMVLLSQQHIYTTKHFILLSLFKTPGSDPIPSYTGIISTSNSLTHTREFQVLAFFDLEHCTINSNVLCTSPSLWVRSPSRVTTCGQLLKTKVSPVRPYFLNGSDAQVWVQNGKEEYHWGW